MLHEAGKQNVTSLMQRGFELIINTLMEKNKSINHPKYQKKF
jgi:hypothetical protein